ncbi:MAG: NUDIX domain-containing protein, partial [Treponema sp.]|nr:NUDIX domain-containing protein [Treponema sp.]
MADKLSIACIARDGNKVLIAHRQNIGQMGGRWEFPGGKVENGEEEK